MKHHSAAGTAADKTVHYVTLELDGEEYSLIFDFNALALAEQLCKVNLLAAFSPEGMTAGQLRGMLWASMQKAQPAITLQQVGDLITLKDLTRIREAVAQSWLQSMGQSDETENPPQPEQGPA